MTHWRPVAYLASIAVAAGLMLPATADADGTRRRSSSARVERDGRDTRVVGRAVPRGEQYPSRRDSDRAGRYGDEDYYYEDDYCEDDRYREDGRYSGEGYYGRRDGRWKDRAEASREWEKDRREAEREWAKAEREAWKEEMKERREWEKERAKAEREYEKEWRKARKEGWKR